MAKYTFSQKAIKDLNSIWNYTVETWSEKQADKYYNIIVRQIDEISKNPQLGRSYYEVEENLLGLKVQKHIIFYQIKENTIEVIRVLHAQMDLKNRLKE
ncbi:MAG: type II toxin-antitoxin system RelE/ParE family toxin [Bacteroidia bacterium]